MRPVEFGEALAAGTRLTLFSRDKPDRFFIVIKFWTDETSGIALALKTGLPSYQVEDEEGRIQFTTSLTNRERKSKSLVPLAAPDPAGFDSASIFDAPKIAEAPKSAQNRFSMHCKHRDRTGLLMRRKSI